MRAGPDILIGTSGWHYKDWVGPFYPAGLRPKDFLAHYARHFSTTEVNSTFYSLPRTETLAAWRDRTPEGFVFSCKASRYITHMKKLRDPQVSCRRFLAAIEPPFSRPCRPAGAPSSSSVTRAGSCRRSRSC